MEPMPLISSTLDLLLTPLALIFFTVWIIRRRKIRRKDIEAKKLEKKPYTTAQVFGIIGILFFILPVFWAVGIMLQKGLYFLAILFSGWIALPKTISIIIKTTFFVSTLFFLFPGVYLVCEMIWPKQYTDEIDRTGMGTGTPYHFRLQHSDTKELFIRWRLI